MKRRGLDAFFWVGAAFLGLLLVFAVVGPTFRHDFLDQVGRPYEPPGARFWLGTDELGRDVFARLAYGARVSLQVGLTVQFLALVVGVVVGVLGVLGRRWMAGPLMRLTDGMFAFPDILLAILIIGVWDRGMFPVIVALSVTAWPSVARLVRGQVATLKDREFVIAAQAMGARTPYLVVRHMLPHLVGVLLAVSMIDLAGVILAESALSFLGIGVQSPIPSWGSMINGARVNMNSYPLLLLWPCLLLSLTIFALNFVGDGLRAAFDPRSK
jgi:ABC-type dipeptide/oligopeptide/nickel transport system permease subunit